MLMGGEGGETKSDDTQHGHAELHDRVASRAQKQGKHRASENVEDQAHYRHDGDAHAPGRGGGSGGEIGSAGAEILAGEGRCRN